MRSSHPATTVSFAAAAAERGAAEIGGLVGPNGSGKSTLVKVISGVYRRLPRVVLRGPPGRANRDARRGARWLTSAANVFSGEARSPRRRSLGRRRRDRPGADVRTALTLLDEPSLGLAPVIVDVVFDTIQEIHGDGVAIPLIEQNVRRALAVSQRGYLLSDGCILRSGPSAALLEDPEAQRVCLGV